MISSSRRLVGRGNTSSTQPDITYYKLCHKKCLLKGIPSNMIRNVKIIIQSVANRAHQAINPTSLCEPPLTLHTISLVQLVACVIGWYVYSPALRCLCISWYKEAWRKILIVDASALNNWLLIDDRFACHIRSFIITYKLTPITSDNWMGQLQNPH